MYVIKCDDTILGTGYYCGGYNPMCFTVLCERTEYFDSVSAAQERRLELMGMMELELEVIEIP